MSFARPVLPGPKSPSAPLVDNVTYNQMVLQQARWALAVIAGVNPDGTQTTDKIPYGSVIGKWPGAQNLLVNGGFEVWQRGNIAPNTHNAFFADRWQIQLSGGAGLSVSQDNTYTAPQSVLSAVCSYTPNVGGYVGIFQSLEDTWSFQGQTVTFSVQVKTSIPLFIRLADSFGQTDSATAVLGIPNTWQTLTVTRTIAYNTTAVTVVVYATSTGAATQFNVDNAMLIVGPYNAVPPKWQPEPFPLTLLRCQRYYQTIVTTLRWYAQYPYQYESVPIPFRQSMFGAPTITTSGGVSANVSGGSFVANTADGAAYQNLSLVAGDAYVINRVTVLESNP